MWCQHDVPRVRCVSCACVRRPSLELMRCLRGADARCMQNAWRCWRDLGSGSARISPRARETRISEKVIQGAEGTRSLASTSRTSFRGGRFGLLDSLEVSRENRGLHRRALRVGDRPPLSPAFKKWRSLKLQESDWMMLSDTPAITTAWSTYRQALRDLPSNAEYPASLSSPSFVPLDPNGE